MLTDTCKPISFKLGMIDTTDQTLQFDASFNDCDFHSTSKLYEKVRTFVQNVFGKSQLILMKFSMLLGHVAMLRLISISFGTIIKRENLTVVI